jgi:hypothetical protein
MDNYNIIGNYCIAISSRVSYFMLINQVLHSMFLLEINWGAMLMKGILFVLLMIVLLSSCAAEPSGAPASNTIPLQTPTQPSSSTASAVILSHSPSPTLTPETTMPEQTQAGDGSQSDTPDPTPDPSLPKAAPGPGLKIGDIVIASGNFIYYYDEVFSSSGDYGYTAIYQFDKKAGKAKIIRKFGNECCGMEQIFLDAKGNLYYVLENEKYQFLLYKYQKTEDLLIGDAGNGVDRVDDAYIYTQDVWYSLKDYKPVHGDPSLFTAWKDGYFTVTCSLADTGTRFEIKDNMTGAVRTCVVNETIKPDNLVNTLVQGGKLFIATTVYEDKSSTIYVIDIAKNKVVNQKQISDEISSCVTENGRMYFLSMVCTNADNAVYINREVSSYDLKSYEINLFKTLEVSTDEEEATYIDIAGGYLWVYNYAGGDYEGYYAPTKYILK